MGEKEEKKDRDMRTILSLRPIIERPPALNEPGYWNINTEKERLLSAPKIFRPFLPLSTKT